MSKTGCDNVISRRDALKLTAAVPCALAFSAGPLEAIAGPNSRFTQASAPGHVVKIHMPGMRGKWFPHKEAAAVAVNRAVTALAGQSDQIAAWSRFVAKEDRVGIKINCLGGRMASTNIEVVDAIIEGVRSAGVPDQNIMVFDQFGGNMRGARYLWQDKPGRLRVINHEVVGYEKNWTDAGGGRGKLSKALTWCTAVINMPVLKDHDLAGAGITCALKNMVFGCVESPHIMHGRISTVLPHFYAREEIRSRVRLTIVDGSFCQYDGGPKHNPSAHVTHDSIYASTDPVAMDAVAFDVIEGLRKKNNLKSLQEVGRPVKYLDLAQEIGLGIAARDKIFLETITLPPFTGASA